jgi:uncharacterized protein YndB with AHSA1/START domain
MTSAAPRDYVQRQVVRAPRARVFEALTTLAGLRGWWTSIVDGDALAGGELRFGFEGLDETIVLRVDQASRATRVRWTCVVHSSLPEWTNTVIELDLAERGTATDLRLRHRGLTPVLACYDHCEAGWNHFLASLAAYVEDGVGMPYRARRSARRVTR